MIYCECLCEYDEDEDEEYFSECSVCGEMTCDDCCAPVVDGEPRTCEGCGP